jgi:hypothetical protein
VEVQKNGNYLEEDKQMKLSLMMLLYPLILAFNVEAQSSDDLSGIIDRCEQQYSSSGERLDCMQQALDNPGQFQNLEPAQGHQESRKDASDCARLEMMSAQRRMHRNAGGKLGNAT